MRAVPELDLRDYTVTRASAAYGEGSIVRIGLASMPDAAFDKLNGLLRAQQRIAIRYPEDTLTVMLTDLHRKPDGTVTIDAIQVGRAVRER
jgi:hypothetical protein